VGFWEETPGDIAPGLGDFGADPMMPEPSSRGHPIAAWIAGLKALPVLLVRAARGMSSAGRMPLVAAVAGGVLVLTMALIVRSPGGAAEPSAPKAMPLPQVYETLKKIAQIQSGQEFFSGAHFVGSQACTGCHRKQVEEWRGTWHSKMEQWPTPETVLGDFTDQVITFRDIEVTDATEKVRQKVTFQIRAHRAGFFRCLC